MGHRHSNEDEVPNISTLIFVTNFPDQFYAKDLWKANYSTSLMGKVKEFSSLTNLKVVLDNEGKVLCVRAKEIFGWIPDFVEDDEGESDSDDEIRDEGLHDENVDKHKYATVEGEK
ncbi:hypothetical protein Tco_0281654 [Tanacetum coccineum]